MKPFSLVICPFLLLNLFANIYADENEKGFKIEKKEEVNITSIQNQNDVVSYSSHKGDQKYIADLGEKYKGLSDEKKINDLLKQGNYIEVLNYLWTEPNATKRLTWLEKKANEGYPLMMFELANEYYLQDPTLSTYVLKTMPWMLAGAKRTVIDAACTSDASVSAAPEFLLSTYQGIIEESLRSKYSQEEIEKFLADHLNEFKKNNITVLKNVLEPFISGSKNIPAANWVFAHGLDYFTNTQNNIPDSQCETIRKKEAEEFLKQANEVEKSIKS